MRTAADATTLTASYPAIAYSVGAARNAVVELAAGGGATQEQLDGVRLAVSEAVSNVVTHAYRGTSGSVHLTAAVVEEELTVLVADDGCGLHVRTDSPGLGLGLPWMAELSDDLTVVARACGGLEVRLRFSLGSEVGTAAESTPRVASFC